MNQWKARFARQDDGARTRAEAMRGADLFLGLLEGGALHRRDAEDDGAATRSSSRWPTPIPEIGYPEAKAARPDAIVATGRSDFPNQVNNVLGFPYIFRGALDVRAKEINEAMKIAAARALAALAHEPVPDSVAEAYGVQRLQVRPRLHHPEAVRHARPLVVRAGRGQGGHGVGRRAAARWTSTSTASGCSAASAARSTRSCARSCSGRRARPSGSSSPTATTSRCCAPARSRSTSRSRAPSCSATRRRSASAPPSSIWISRGWRSSTRPIRPGTPPTPPSTWRCAAARA